MATIKTFEDIEAWQIARDISIALLEIRSKTKLKNDYGLWDQINKSSGSIMDNIAEGYERGGNKEFIQFLYIAKGSTGELTSQFYRLKDREYINKEQFEQFHSDLKKCRNKILGLINYLKTSERKGQKFDEPEINYGSGVET